MSNSNFWDIKDDGTFAVLPGSSIESTLQEARKLAQAVNTQDTIEVRTLRTQTNQPEGDFIVTFTFNGVVVKVGERTDIEWLRRDWCRGMSGYLGDNPVVGPDPKPELSKKELANDARIESENQVRRDAKSARYQAEARAHRERVEARMQDAPEMEFSDEAAWLAAKAANEGEPYGAGILSYAERWARMMQLEMSEGKPIEEVWNSTSHEADLEGMSGFSQGAATHLLTQCWVHGGKLRRLHNAYWGSDSTEGTVNPAIITVTSED